MIFIRSYLGNYTPQTIITLWPQGFMQNFFLGGGGSLRIQVVLIPIIASWWSGGAVSSSVVSWGKAPGIQKQSSVLTATNLNNNIILCNFLGGGGGIKPGGGIPGRSTPCMKPWAYFFK